MNYSYISLLTNNEFMPALIAMLDSYNQVKTNYPMAVMVLPEVSKENRDIINFLGAEVIEVSQLHPTKITTEFKGTEDLGRSYHTCMCKLHLFRLIQFDKVIYIDADMVFIHNIDELFNNNGLSAVPDPGYSKNNCYFNAGLLVIEPSLEVFNSLLNIMENYSTKENWKTILGYDTSKLDDQQILYEYFYSWNTDYHLHLNSKYNTMLSYYNWYNEKNLYEHKNIKILHMTCSLRPWNNSLINEYYSILSIPALAVYMWWVAIINNCIKKILLAGYYSNDLKIIDWYTS